MGREGDCLTFLQMKDVFDAVFRVCLKPSLGTVAGAGKELLVAEQKEVNVPVRGIVALNFFALDHGKTPVCSIRTPYLLRERFPLWDVGMVLRVTSGRIVQVV